VEPLGVLWEGSFFAHHSLANVNRELSVLLAGFDDVDLGLVSCERRRFGDEVDPRYRAITERLERRPRPVDVYVRHRWPPDFSRPDARRFVLVQPYEYGTAPEAWVRGIADSVDELWVHSRFVRDAYVRSGVDPAKVELIPLGVNPEWFNPDIEPLPLRTEKSFKFLFVGGTLERKGFDLLLRAYAQEFTADDDVTLVVKDFFYGPHGRELVRALRRDPAAPEVRYGYGTMDPTRLGGLYTACDCSVHPYRAEGFCLPIVEAMACGLPVIATGRGPTLDYCTDESAYLVPASEVPYPYEWPKELRTVHPATWFEPDLGELRRLMRHVVEHRDEARHRGALAREHVRTATWQRAAAAVVERLKVGAAAT
jgi:glycosyltransferase involved in cell wall biosynthesis